MSVSRVDAMNESNARFLEFEIKGELAIAGYFLMANWPNPATAPMLVTTAGPMKICFQRSADVLADLKTTLSRVSAYGGKLGESAHLWLESLEGVEPEFPSSSTHGLPSGLSAG